jgi:hypothetical protein
MNERIIKLAADAGAHWEHGDWNLASSVHFTEEELEKFAELIVQECSRQVLSTVLLEGDDGSTAEVLMHASFQLKLHFGVEL